MCESLVPSCTGFVDWEGQVKSKGAPIMECFAKNMLSCAKECPPGPSISEGCIKCIAPHCPSFPEMAKCVECTIAANGGKLPTKLTEAIFEKCAGCGGAGPTPPHPAVPIGPPYPPRPPVPVVPVVGGDPDLWIGIGVAAVVAVIIVVMLVSRR